MTPGHRVMMPEQIVLIEKVRALGIAIEGVLIEADRFAKQHLAQTVVGSAEWRRVAEAEPKRWLAMARTDLQCGLMKLTRSIAQPSFF